MGEDYHLGSDRYVTIEVFSGLYGGVFPPEIEDKPCRVLSVCIRDEERHVLCSDMILDTPTPFFDIEATAFTQRLSDMYALIGAVRCARFSHPDDADYLDIWERELYLAHRRFLQGDL